MAPRTDRATTVMWAAMADAMYAKCFRDVYDNPGIDVDQSVRDLPGLIRGDRQLTVHWLLQAAEDRMMKKIK